MTQRTLHAGPVTAELDGIDLRYVRVGNVEIARRVYAAVRDPEWATIEPELGEVVVEQGGDRFRVRFEAIHTTSEIDFEWRGTITGEPDGTLVYDFDGRAGRDMQYARMGICVHHPLRETVGRSFRARTPHGEISGAFPSLVGQQAYENGVYLPLFPSFDRIEIDLEAGGLVRFEFEGDLWETEDHRNWTDANFKTYSTPMALGFPHDLEQGQALAQKLKVSTVGAPRTDVRDRRVELRVGDPIATFPPIGLAQARGGKSLAPSEVALLRELGPAHLRADIRLDRDDWLEHLRRAQAECEQLECSLELALHLRPEDEGVLGELARALEEGPPTGRVLVILASGATATAEETTPGSLVSLVRAALQAAIPNALFAGGTDLYFCELNRTRPEADAMDGVFYPIMPQMHAFSDRDIIENLEAQGHTVASARELADGKAVIVGPVTLRGRFAYSRASGEEEVPDDGIPASVDPRQVTPLGAAWTAGSLKFLADAGATSVTYYETTGMRGVIDTDDGSAGSALSSDSGQAFPLYHVLASAARLRGADVLACTSTAPLEAVGLAVRKEGELSVLVTDLTGRGQELTVVAPAGRPRQLALGPFETRTEIVDASA
jgi:D-apionolactonase